MSRAFTAGYARTTRLGRDEGSGDAFTLRTQFDLTDMLRPAVQPGSKLDYEFPAGGSEAPLTSPAELKPTSATARGFELSHNGGTTTGFMEFNPKRGQPIAASLRWRTASELTASIFSLAYSTNEDKQPRPLQLHRMLLPWADVKADLAKPVALPRLKELDGGSWARGRKIYFSDQAACFQRHSVSGAGRQHRPGPHEPRSPRLRFRVPRHHATEFRD